VCVDSITQTQTHLDIHTKISYPLVTALLSRRSLSITTVNVCFGCIEKAYQDNIELRIDNRMYVAF
jgi:hypothetical protein